MIWIWKKLPKFRFQRLIWDPGAKELHKRGERVYKEDFLETIPNYLLELLYHFDDRLSTE